ncbi:TPA: dATP/dGTP pyrophosphohydrolase domain-containing protein [Salmonella enterica subsp. enterica serovar Muenchen]
MTTITREQLHERARRKVKELEFAITQSAFTSIRDGLNEELELARIALAALTAESVAYNQVQRDIMKDIIVRKLGGNLLGDKLMMADIHAVTMALIQAGFRTAPPASERERIRREHAEWSDKTFGDVGPVGPLKHLSKEALEAAADPSDPLEWADMQFLLWDAQRRMGISDEFITRAMVEKLAINKGRQWPEPKDGEPRLHIKEQSAPVVPDERAAFNAWNNEDNLPIAGVGAKNAAWLAWQARASLCGNSALNVPPERPADSSNGDDVEAWFDEGWNACRAAMLQGSQPVSNRDELQVIGWLRSDYNSDDKRDPNAPLFMLGRNDPSETWGVKYIPLSGNSPVIPCGWISCSERMPDREYVLAGDFSGTHYLASIPNVQVGIYADWFDDEKPCWDDGDGNDLHLKEVTHWMPLPEPPQEVK